MTTASATLCCELTFVGTQLTLPRLN